MELVIYPDLLLRWRELAIRRKE